MSVNKKTINTSNIFDVVKVFAIISVILAHSRVNDSSLYSVLAERIGAIRVITFFFISGYFFNQSKYGVKIFFLKKVKSIFVPWIFLGSLVYIVGNEFSFLSWLNWLIGNGTYLYYLTSLIFCYLIYSFFFKKWYSHLFIILNLISLVLTSFGIIDQIWENYLGFGSFNNYLNTFNWLGFFSLGVLLKRNMKYWLDKLNKNIFFILITYLSLLILSILLEPSSGGYFSKLAIPLELAGMFMFFSFATLNIFHKPIVYKISKFTFTIYLLHFLVFPFRKFLINDYFFQFLNPIFYLLICSGVIYVGKNFSKKIKLGRVFNVLMGVR